MQTEDLMGLPRVISTLGISRVAVHKAINEGRLPFVKVDGRTFIRRVDVESYQVQAYAGRPGRKPSGVKKGAGKKV